jgi:solute carrier family 12 sodium/potassium/chloride transporter 2
VGLITNVLLLLIALIGMTWESKVQLFLLAILMLALLNFVIGSFLPGSELKPARGFVGYSFELFVENMKPDFRNGENFAHVFGIFFPAVTGILAGCIIIIIFFLLLSIKIKINYNDF